MSKTALYRKLRKLVMIALALLLLAAELAYRLGEVGEVGERWYMILTRFISGGICLLLMWELDFRRVLSPLGNKKAMALLAIAPTFLIAVNNFPFASFFMGDCAFGVNATLHNVLMYALLCLSVGFFEEIAFRGCVFMYLLKSRTKSRLGIFMSVFWSAIVFGAIHFVNIFGGSVGAVLLQIGYSALIGALCSVLLMKTGNIWLCVLFHAIYNFAGGIIGEAGAGIIWTAPEIILTAAVAVPVAAYTVWLFFRIPLNSVEDLYCRKEIKYDNL